MQFIWPNADGFLYPPQSPCARNSNAPRSACLQCRTHYRSEVLSWIACFQLNTFLQIAYAKKQPPLINILFCALAIAMQLLSCCSQSGLGGMIGFGGGISMRHWVGSGFGLNPGGHMIVPVPGAGAGPSAGSQPGTGACDWPPGVTAGTTGISTGPHGVGANVCNPLGSVKLSGFPPT